MIDLSKVVLATQYNSFKNNNIYTGSINFPTSVAAGVTTQTTVTIALNETPNFSKFFGYFQEFTDTDQQYTVGSGYNGAEWYPSNVGGQGDVGLLVITPLANAGPYGGFLYGVIQDNALVVTASITNIYSSTATYQALNVPFAFIDYSLSR